MTVMTDLQAYRQRLGVLEDRLEQISEMLAQDDPVGLTYSKLYRMKTYLSNLPAGEKMCYDHVIHQIDYAMDRLVSSDQLTVQNYARFIIRILRKSLTNLSRDSDSLEYELTFLNNVVFERIYKRLILVENMNGVLFLIKSLDLYKKC